MKCSVFSCFGNWNTDVVWFLKTILHSKSKPLDDLTFFIKNLNTEQGQIHAALLFTVGSVFYSLGTSFDQSCASAKLKYSHCLFLKFTDQILSQPLSLFVSLIIMGLQLFLWNYKLANFGECVLSSFSTCQSEGEVKIQCELSQNRLILSQTAGPDSIRYLLIIYLRD